MKVHHLNCATMHPACPRLSHDPGDPRRFVCHVLLIETEQGLVLVDSGLGTADVAEKAKRLGKVFVTAVSPDFNPEETALAQVKARGFDPKDVTNIVLTHLDLDHAGGLPDFPHAAVHLLADEHAAAMNPSRREKDRYIQAHWAHGPNWVLHREPDGEDWFGFDCVRQLKGLPPELLLVPVRGHTRGHTAVAVQEPEGWLLHCGDAYFHHDEMGEDPRCPPGVRLFQRVVQVDGRRLRNQARLRELAHAKPDDVRLFSAHDAVEFGGFA